jgi:hypothetical protein
MKPNYDIWKNIILSSFFTGFLFLFTGLYYFSLGHHFFTSIIIILGFFLIIIAMVSSYLVEIIYMDEIRERNKKKDIILRNRINNLFD